RRPGGEATCNRITPRPTWRGAARQVSRYARLRTQPGRRRDVGIDQGSGTVRAGGVAAWAAATRDRERVGGGRLAVGAGARRAGGVRAGGIPGAGATAAALSVRARGLPVPAAVRLPVRVGLPPGRPAVRPAEPRAAGSGRSGVAADARRPVDADVGGLAGDRVPAVPVRGAVAEQGTCTQSGQAPIGG